MDRGYDDNKMFLKLNELKQHEAYLSHVKVQITASRKDIYLVLVYGIMEHPMMLATNKEITSKEDVIKVAALYFSRWRIEEYFRCKKTGETADPFLLSDLCYSAKSSLAYRTEPMASLE